MRNGISTAKAQRAPSSWGMNDSFDATLKYRDIEADEQSEAKPSGFQVRQGLGHVKRGDGFARLQLDHEALVHKEVEARLSNTSGLVMHRDRYLAGEADAPKRQLDTQCFFVHGFQKSRPEMSMYFYRGPNDSMRNRIQPRVQFLSPHILGDLCVLAVHPLPSARLRKELPAFTPEDCK